MAVIYTRIAGIFGGGGGGGGVTSLNTLVGSITLAAGSGINLSIIGNTITISNTEAGGSVTSVSVVSANGFAGTVANPTTTPAITLSTTISGLLQGSSGSLAAYTGGNFTDSTSGADGITITGGTGSVIGSGTSIAQQVATTSQNGYLASTDWNTFNSKQSALTLPLAISQGGTGQTTQTASFNALSPLTTAGDMIYYNGLGNNVRLAIGAANYVLTSLSGTHPTWSQSVAGNANLTLSNLTSPTAVNVPLLPGGDNFNSIGSASNRWAAIGAVTQLIYGSTSGTLTLQTPAVVTSYTLTMPSAQGTGALTNNGSGGLSWTPAATPLTFSDSLVNTAGNVTLVNDSASPTASQYYGTNASSVLGYFNTSGLTVANITATSNSTLTTLSALSLPGSQVSGTVAVANGGTGDNSFTANQPVIGGTTSTGALAQVSTGTAGYFLQSNGSAAPTWANLAAYSGGAFYASSQITTKSTAVTSSSYTTFSNSPGLSFTPTITGTYKVYGSFPIYCSTTGDVGNVRIFNTSGGATLLYQSDSTQVGYAGGSVGNGSAVSIYCQSIYTLTAGTTYVFNVQGASPQGANVYLDTTDFMLTGCYMFAEGVVTGTGALSLAAVGSSPNANAATLSASTLNLQPFNSSFPGVVPASGGGTTNFLRADGSWAAIVAPAGTLTGTTLASNVVTSSLTTVGTITTGVWNGTVTAGQSLLTSGTTYTTPAGISSSTVFKFTIIGGGGGGGGAPGTANYTGSGGGAGGSGIVYVTGLSPSTGYTMAIGSGGTVSSDAAGGAGGNTSITIGATTYTANGGSGGAVAASTAIAGGSGGTTTNMTIGITGPNGGNTSATGAGNISSHGGSTLLGFGGIQPVRPSTGSTAGTAGTGYGSGGSGGCVSASSVSATSGGAGAAGCILVEWKN